MADDTPIETANDTAEPAPEPQPLTLRERIGESLFNRVLPFMELMTRASITTLKDVVPDTLSAIFDVHTGKVEDTTKSENKKRLLEMLDASGMRPEIKSVLRQEIVDDVFTNRLELMFLIAGNGLGVLGALTGVASIPAQQSVLEKLKPIIPDISVLMPALWRDPQTKNIVDNFFQRSGYGDDARKIIDLAARQVLMPETIRELFLRGEIDDSKNDKLLRAHGYNEDDIANLKKLYTIIPPIQDLIRMGVREVFTPQIAEAFGQFEDYPEQLTEFAQKVGLNEKWAKNYWAAHWELPSLQMGYEMLHRNVIDEDELKTLMRALDIMPNWRDKLIEISYSPYTRVDVRRMYKLGVIDESEVLKTYRDLGYDDEHANNLTEFVKAYTAEDEKELTKTDVLNALKRKIIDSDEATAYLTDIGYDSLSIEILIAKTLYEKEKQTKTLTLTRVKNRFLKGIIDEGMANIELDRLNVSANERAELVKEWTVDKEGKEPELSMQTLQQMFMAKIIDENTLKKELKNKGYNRKHLNWLLELTKRKVTAK